jgi:zinc protease
VIVCHGDGWQARLSDEDVEAERQIIIEEWRQTRSGGLRASEHFVKILLEGSLYPERFPIGLMEVRARHQHCSRSRSRGLLD